MRIFNVSLPFWVASILLCASHATPAKILTGLVTRVADGDTLWVRLIEGGAPVKVRFQGIDAPETCQDWGKQAGAALRRKTLNQTVELDTRARDKFGRIVARISTKGEDLGAWMVAQGHAWSNHYYDSDGPYAAQEASARSARIGLWALPKPIEPKAFRKSNGVCVYPGTVKPGLKK